MIVIESKSIGFRRIENSWNTARVLIREIKDFLWKKGFREFNEEFVYDANGRIESRILSAYDSHESIEFTASPL